MVTKALLVFGFLAMLPVIAFAQGNDPHVGVQQDGAGPLPVSQDLNDVQPDSRACTLGDGTCSFIFYNDTPGIIDAFTFDTSFSAASFTPPADETYTCDGLEYGYFESCTASLTLNDGVYNLDYSFFGVEPSNGDGYSDQNPTGAPEGIAPGDVFFIQLDGWSGGFQDLALTNTLSVPEASSVLILLTELLLLAGLAKLLGLRWNRSWRGTVQSE